MPHGPARHRRRGSRARSWLYVTALSMVAAACARQRPALNAPLPPAPSASESRPGENWPIRPARAEQLFASAPMELRAYKELSAGVAGAFKAQVAFAGARRRINVKWKAAPPGDFDGWNNNPRKELAAYAVQKWFLDPKDYLVPTVAVRCVPVEAFRRFDPGMKPSLEGADCVMGSMFLWLEDVEIPDELYEPEEFVSDRWYAYHLSNFNVHAYLIENRDCRPGNILVPDEDDEPRRVYAIDNGISFGEPIYNFLTTNWHVIRVPAIRREVVDRLRLVDRKKLDALGTLVELAIDREGTVRPVLGGAPIDPDRGVRVTRDRVQMGLTRAEIADVEARLKALLKQVDDGTLPVF
jgi:hypothetical protein